MRKFSKKRQKQNREYSKLLKEFLKNKTCEGRFSGCTGDHNLTCHHSKGRVGSNFLDTSTWVVLCFNCHQYAELHPLEMKELKISANRLD